VLVLRDTQGVAKEHAVIPPPLVPVVARFDGASTCVEIARATSAELGVEVPVDVVVDLASRLDERLMLEGPTFARALAETRDAFDRVAVRPATHAGGAYPADRDELSAYLNECIARASRSSRPSGASPSPVGELVGLIAPHIDPWRGAVGYGHAYGALAATLPTRAQTFVVLGTSHAPMREPFALCRKAFDTPLGPIDVDGEAVDALASACAFDPWADGFNHKREHSIEFQAVFLKHVLKGRPTRIVPILAGLGEHQAHATDPCRDPRVKRFLDALRELVSRESGRVVVVAGADLAHVGPRFGDRAPGDAARETLARTDGASLDHVVAGASREFWSHVVADLDTRRVCGLAPIFTMLEVLPEDTRGTRLHYEQTVDDDGSVVSHAAVGLYAPASR
jgi:AmmeMemoRadiSam system protein B